MIKVIIAGHKLEADSFVDSLQQKSLLHITGLSGESSDLFLQDNKHYKKISDSEKILMSELKEARSFLESFKEKKSLIEELITPPQHLKEREFNDLFQRSNPKEIINKVNELRKSISDLNGDKISLIEIREELKHYRNITIPVEDCGSRNSYDIDFASVDSDRLEILRSFESADIEVLGIRGNQSIILVAVHSSAQEDAKNFFKKQKMISLEFPISKGSPRENYDDAVSSIKKIDEEVEALKKKAEKLLSQLIEIEVMIQSYKSFERQSDLFEKWLTSENAFIINGWIREKDYSELEEISSTYNSISLEKVEKPEDLPPVAFEKNRVFSPFQLITRLYSLPGNNSVDPSPVTSVFFAIFFGLCLTDAGYGLILAIIALVGIWKFQKGKDLLWILFWGGILTVVAGILTGGIFGDLFRQQNPFVNIPVINSLRESLTWFDPMKEPMVFFRLVLFLGVVHVLTGLVIGIASNLKQKLFADAFVDKFSWFTIVISLLAILFSSDMSVKMSLVSGNTAPLPVIIQTPAIITLSFMAVVVILFSARDEETLFFRFFIGFLKLVILSGIFSYLGDILSYIRLMALGMVTAGIGMAINTIAFMLYDIPFAGVILTVVVLIFGHLFNMAINLLGAFVHTLRLQYVEFFSKFFIGGGKEFSPLSIDETYIKITE